MYCPKCGTENTESCAFCRSCGEELKSNTEVVKESNRNKLIGIGAVVAAALAVIILICAIFGGNGGYKAVVENYFKAHEKCNADILERKVYAQYWLNYWEDGWTSNINEFLQEEIEEELDGFNVGDRIKIEYKVTNTRKLSKRDVERIEDYINDYFIDRDEKDCRVTQAYRLNVEYKVKGKYGTEDYTISGMTIIKENGKWKMAPGISSIID